MLIMSKYNEPLKSITLAREIKTDNPPHIAWWSHRSWKALLSQERLRPLGTFLRKSRAKIPEKHYSRKRDGNLAVACLSVRSCPRKRGRDTHLCRSKTKARSLSLPKGRNASLREIKTSFQWCGFYHPLSSPEKHYSRKRDSVPTAQQMVGSVMPESKLSVATLTLSICKTL